MAREPAEARFPVLRPRRLRGSETLRRMVRETQVTTDDLVYPLFVATGHGIKREIGSMPGNFHWSVDRLTEEVEEIAALGIPAYHQRPSAPTNLTLHQAIDINVPIGCGDAPVFPGDIILGDQDGVIVIPANLLDEIADETFEMTAYEDFVTEQVRAGKGIFGLYPATNEQSLVDFAAWRKANGR